MYTEQPYTFRLTLRVNVSAINRGINVQELDGKVTIHARLQLCNVILQGFCNPLVDSRDIDSTLQPVKTDLNAEPTAEFAQNSSKWNYKEGSTLLGIPDGSLVFSRWIKWTLKELSDDSPTYTTSVDITLQLPHGIQAVMLFEVNNSTRQRIDVANAMPNNTADVRDSPNIQRVSSAMTITLSVMIGIFGSLALFMFVFVLYHRNHPVMMLAQGSFLAAMTGACLFEIVATFLFLPTRDLYCALAGPLILIPMTFIAASLVGRICRVYRTLAVAQRFARNPEVGASCDWEDRFIGTLFAFANLPLVCATKSKPLKRQSGLRQTATANETVSLIFLLTLPQVLVQVLVSALNDRFLEVVLDPLGNVGHVTCNRSGRWATTFGISYTAFVYMIAVVAAWVSRSLPSAFNEKEQVFHAASISTLLSFVSITMLAIVNNPSTHPNALVSDLSRDNEVR
jgi:7 transmembrane sweet-taste receptor of 3 GCPR